MKETTLKKTITLGVPFTPSRIENKNEYAATAITISWGGGMGGSTQTLYIKKKIELKDLSEPFIKIKTIYDKDVIVSTNHIVKIGTVKVVELDIHNLGNPNCGELNSTYRYVYIFPTDDKIIYVNSYTSVEPEARYKI